MRHFPEDIPKHIRRHHRLINHWIQRSSGLPLSLSLTEGIPASDKKIVAKAFDEILDILLDCCSRWRDVSFHFDSFSYSRIAALTDADVPLLSSIEIVEQSRAKSSQFLDSTIFRAPNLRKFSLPMPSRDVVAKIPVKWEKLSHLTLSIEDPVRIIAEVLRSSKNLSFCHIMTRVTQPADTTYVGDIHLPLLRTLRMTRITRNPCPNVIIQSIKAPLLEILFITEDALPTDMKALLTHSPLIQEINLIHPPTTFENVMEWLEHCPSLKALRFESADHLLSGLPRCTAYARLGDRFLCAFILDNDRLCPALETFWDEDGMAVSLETLERFFAREDVRLGAPGLQPWTKVKLTVALIPSSESRSAVDRLVLEQAAAGMEVDLLVLPPPTASLKKRAHKRSSTRA
ncbi:hypothetical protein HYPSUDRAFT_205914 [Hypholoma sublateritium FD-334 SS-4]|uniref:F-box domain-containing protein n=1 Tax=Hypholoma sublateritium (strain FD-334 SS-4) TaxID=945553 RepID=A0A0D2KT51_HYPSF|nr:hypothetical protein HYPSUDRAFT_205914 [Hypholoma sublateritium FD-334 SS-4]